MLLNHLSWPGGVGFKTLKFAPLKILCSIVPDVNFGLASLVSKKRKKECG